jgi:hypothetical protein
LEHMAEAMSNPAPVTIDEHITMTPLDNSAALASANDFEIADNEDYSLLAAHGPMPPPNVHSLHGFVHDDDLRFSGSSQPISLIADLQAGPTCALETLENMVQAKNPLVGNNLSDWVIQSGWYNPETMGPFPIAWYQHVLSQCGIGSQWVDASPQALLNTISGSNTTAAIMGDPYFLDNPSYKMPGGELHAVTLIEPWIDQSGQAMGFIGIDSNVAGKPCFWSFDQVAQFIGNARQRLGAYGGKALVTL